MQQACARLGGAVRRVRLVPVTSGGPPPADLRRVTAEERSPQLRDLQLTSMQNSLTHVSCFDTVLRKSDAARLSPKRE